MAGLLKQTFDKEALGAKGPTVDVPTPEKVDAKTPDLDKVSKPLKPKKAIYKRWWFWTLAVLLLLVVGVRIALNPMARHFTQKGLDGITGYKGTFTDVKVSIIPLSYTITDLKLVQDGENPEEPMTYIKEVKAGVIGRKLFKGQIVAVAGVYKSKYFIKVGETKPPPEAVEAAKKAKKELEKNDFDISATLDKVIPLRVDRIEMRDSEIVLIDATDPKRPRFWVDDIELVVDNIVTRKKLDENVPMSLTMRAVVQRTGILKVMATADLLTGDKPAFTGQAQLSGLKLESLYAWAAAKAGVSPKGNLDAFINFSSAKNVLSGSVKVMIKDAHVEPATKNIGDAAKAKIANLAISVLSDRVEGRDAIATTLPLKGTLTNPDPQIWPTILGVVRNAFVQGLDWGFSDLPQKTADKEQGPLEQAKEGLDKKESGPKAQPK